MPLTTQHTISQIVSRLLAAQGLGTIPAPGVIGEWPIYISDMPNVPDQIIRITDTQGRTLGRIQLTGEMVDHQGFQVTVRGRRYDTTYHKARIISDAFDTGVYRIDVVLTNPDITYKVQSITRTSDIMPVGVGVSTRGKTLSDLIMFTINAVICINEG